MVKKPSKKKPTAEIQGMSTSPPAGKAAVFFFTPVVQILIIASLGLLIYSNTFQAPFLFDDKISIIDDSSIRAVGGVRDYLNHNRFVGKLTFALNYRLNGLDVVGYHVLNLLIHIVNALLVYWLVRLLFATRQISGANPKDKQSGGAGDWVPFLVALLFVSHPVQTQAVTYIVQRYTSLATMFYLLSFALYFKARTSEAPDSRGMHYICWGLSILCAVAAMKTKEIAFTLPLVIVLGECIFLKGDFKKRFFYLFPFLLTLLIIPMNLLTKAQVKVNAAAGIDTVTRLAKTAAGDISRLDYLITQFRVIVTYLRLMIFPVNQNLDYDYPLYQSLMHPEVLLSLLLLLSLAFLAAFFLYRSYRVRTSEGFWQRLFAFGVFWFFITLSVESSIIPLADFIFEHRLYLPSIGFFLALIVSLVLIIKQLVRGFPGAGRVVVAALLALVLVLSVATYARNDVWRDEARLWEDVVKKSPNKARPNYNVGFYYQKKGRFGEAVAFYQRAIAIRPDYPQALTNLGAVYLQQGHWDDAVHTLLAAVKVDANFQEAYKAYHNLGRAYFIQGRLDDAEKAYLMSIRLKKDHADAYVSLGRLYWKMGRPDEAARVFSSAARFSPAAAAEAYNESGGLYFYRGRLDEAIMAFLEAVRLKPDYPEPRNNLGAVYLKQQRFDDAEREFQAAIALKPDYGDALFNLGWLRQKKGRVEDACRAYEAVLKIDPHHRDARNNLLYLRHEIAEQNHK